MNTFTVGGDYAGVRLDRFLSKTLKNLPVSLIQRHIRKKNVRLNGKHASPDTRLCEGDEIRLFFAYQAAPETAEDFSRLENAEVNAVYEDENILIADKPAGQSVHADNSGSPDNLINHIKLYLSQKGENPDGCALCHRIDRNTSGLVIAAKNAPALRIISEKIRLREIEKVYRCLTRKSPGDGVFRDYILRREDESRVTVFDRPIPGAKTAVTRYRTVGRLPSGLWVIECELETGRTHQIRAQMAFRGYPLVGDGKYGKILPGDPESQCLRAQRVTFAFKSPAGNLEYLKNKTVTAQTAQWDL